MSSALSLIVFGQVYFLGPMSNTLPNTPNTTVSLAIHQGQSPPEPLHEASRNDYTYTPSFGGYKVHTQAAPWNTARKACEQEGAHLAIINSLAESNIIKELVKNSGPHVNSESPEYVHIGFHDLYLEGEYVTIHGESLETTGFNEWADGEPSNGGNIEHCGSVFKDGKLNDIHCQKSVGFVCELPYSKSESVKITSNR